METNEQSESLTPKQRAVNIATFISLGIITAGLGIFLYWLFQSEKVIQVNNEPFPVSIIDDHVSQKVVVLKVDFCKYQNVEGDLRVSFLNDNHEEFLPITRERSEKGCRVSDLPILVPETIKPGKYRIKFTVRYDVNPLKRDIPNEFVSQEFTINKEMVSEE